MRFDDEEAYERYLAALSRSQRWRDQGSDELTRRLKRAPEVFKLSPTPRSLLRAWGTLKKLWTSAESRVHFMRTHHSAFSGSVRRNSLVCASVITSPLRLPLLRSTVQSHFQLPIITRSATSRLSSSRFQYRAELSIRMIMPVASWLSTNYTSWIQALIA